ncbi:MAG: trypsin-like peptidase domain-containing protein [Ignavibacteriae bacterium]|nr:trypsin-like peptidase domain-containing protein [Ignavibacteriota bacterium]
MTSKLKTALFCVFILFIFFSLSCSSSIQEMIHPELHDGKYDSEFPYIDASEELEEITETIRMVHSMVFYTSYTFDRQTRITNNDVRFKNLRDYAKSEISFHQTSAGTAIIVYSKNGKVALLSCAHILDFPDTSISYYYDVLGQKTNIISGISIKDKQTNYIPELSGQPEFKTLVADKDLDLILLGKNIDFVDAVRLRPFKYPLGKSEDLNWGTFVYLFGYPVNNRMITKGIVSPNKKDNSSFLVDASINKGFSGGVVLAIKDGIPNFELVGIVKSGLGKKDYYLKPATGKQFPLVNSKIPYNDNVYVDENLNLRYGITKVISTESILEFLDKNKSQLEDLGYISNYFFN